MSLPGSLNIASETNRTEGSETSILVVVLTMTSIFTLAALTGVFIYKRYKTQRKSAGGLSFSVLYGYIYIIFCLFPFLHL